ncbi:MAG: hypothetical protein COA52_06140 [Hyphomicrobiales bacterium]|nr:MAG: hypothetical protein COA52_06140 [Hyphomicrobiales bacterium]
MLLEDTFSVRANAADHRITSPFGYQIEQVYDQALRLDVPSFKLAGLARKPVEMVHFLRCHGARARRQTLPRKHLVLECYNSAGTMGVDISFGEQS